ncbi:MAG: outer membrane beta-barrel protein [Deltaproteobacteria bacterium]|nr:outer membrane beta-barrel protein [Deltaproteobacteria bacterium]
MKTIRTLLVASLALGGALASAPAQAADEPTPAAAPTRHGAGNKGFFVTGKVGGIVPFGGLGPNAIGGIDLGYALDMGLAFGVAADYAAPKADGTETDARVAGGQYKWHLTQQMLQVMPFVMYRIKTSGLLVPYAGVGPRIYMLQSFVKGEGPAFQETREQSTKVGVGVPLGLEIRLGPGAAIAELLLQYGGLNHTATGDSNAGAASLSLGYRMMF